MAGWLAGWLAGRVLLLLHGPPGRPVSVGYALRGEQRRGSLCPPPFGLLWFILLEKRARARVQVFRNASPSLAFRCNVSVTRENIWVDTSGASEIMSRIPVTFTL